jgi:hypothetical protein
MSKLSSFLFVSSFSVPEGKKKKKPNLFHFKIEPLFVEVLAKLRAARGGV